MSAENKDLARRFYEGSNAGKLEVIEEIVADEMTEHEEFPGLASGRLGVRQFFQMMRTAFPDFQMTMEDIFADGDRVVIRARMSGTHHGTFMDMPATGQRMDVPFADFVRFHDGKVVEHWGVTDTGAMMQQLKG